MSSCFFVCCILCVFCWVFNLKVKDIDFDRKDELLITEWQGGSGAYEAYKIYDYYADKMAYAPFDTLDDDTRFDHSKKTITLYDSDGAYASNKLVYRRYNAPDYPNEIKDDWVGKMAFDKFYSENPFRLDTVEISIERTTGKQKLIFVRKGDKLELK